MADKPYPPVGTQKWAQPLKEYIDDRPSRTQFAAEAVDPATVLGAALSDTIATGAVSRSSKLARFRADLANSRNALCTVVTLGNSVDEGQGATVEANRFTAHLRRILQRGWPSSAGREAVGYIPVNYFVTSFPEVFTITGTYTENNNWGPGGRALRMEPGSEATATVSGTSVDLLFGKATFAGRFEVLIDGVSQGTTQTAAAANTDGHTLRITLPGNGSHALVVKPYEAFPVIFEGIIVNDGNESSGVRHIDAGHWGWTTTLFAPGGNGGTSLGEVMATLNPSLVTIGLTENDYKAGLAIATFKAQVEAIIAKIRLGGADPDILLIARPERSDDAEGGPLYPEYVAALREVASADARVDFLDLTLLMTTVAADTLGLWVDAVHPSDKGHALIGQFVAGYITAGIQPAAKASVEVPEDRIIQCLVPSPFVATSGTPAVVSGSGTYAALAYDASTQEAAITRLRVPSHWLAVDVELKWLNVASSGSGDVTWRMNMKQQGDGELAGANLFDTTITSTVPATQWTAASTKFASNVAVNPAKDIILSVIRMAAAGQDTFTADVGAAYVRLIRTA